jgi:spore coat polysaccharide biosynthesis protein SpsF
MIGVVLQARMGSTRLPGKVLRDLCGKPMLAHVLDRLRRMTGAEALIVATSEVLADDAVDALCARECVPCFRGSELDVLERYHRAAERHGLTHVVRATADNPFVDFEEGDRLIALHLATGADYTHAFGQLPLGVGLECFARAALTRSFLEGHAPNHREHVNEYIQERPSSFHIQALEVPASKCAPGLRLTVDTPDDFARATAIYRALYTPATPPRTEDAIRLCASC